MNSRQRVLAVMNLQEIDIVPFMDCFDAGIKETAWESTSEKQE